MGSEIGDAEVGPVRYALEMPALGAADYARLQAVLLRGLPRARPGWRGRLAGFLVALVAGGTGGYLASEWDVTTEFWIGSARQGWQWTLDGFGVVLAVLGMMLATLLLFALPVRARQHDALRALHAAGGELFGAHALLLGERGIFWHNASRTLVVPWSRITGAVRREGMLFLLADRISAFWLPEAVIAAHPDRAGLEAFLRQHASLP
jgi:hypothetical protein